MRKIGNMASQGVIRGLLGLRRSSSPIGDVRISNRKSGIRIRSKSQELNTIQISNRKYSPLLRLAEADRGF
jgi:hypothetical protein